MEETETADDVLCKAAKRTKQALCVIEQLDLLGRWSRCGRPSLIGAVRFGLVVNRDIDLSIYSESPMIQQGFEVISEIAALRGVVKIRYSNCLETIDQGLYWQIEYRDRLGDTWKVDNWLLSESVPHVSLTEALADRMPRILTSKLRMSILQIKESVQPDSKVRGIDIYEAVIEHGVQSPREFLAWWRHRARPEISKWLPPGQSQPG